MKIKTTFTPGPWGISKEMGDTRVVNLDGYGRVLGLITRLPLVKDWPNSDANAALIAAAPTMYAALESIEADINKHLAAGSPSTFMTLVNVMSAQSKLIRAAIAKAKGE